MATTRKHNMHLERGHKRTRKNGGCRTIFEINDCGGRQHEHACLYLCLLIRRLPPEVGMGILVICVPCFTMTFNLLTKSLLDFHPSVSFQFSQIPRS